MACRMIIVTVTKDAEHMKQGIEDFMFEFAYHMDKDEGWKDDHGQFRAVFERTEDLVG